MPFDYRQIEDALVTELAKTESNVVVDPQSEITPPAVIVRFAGFTTDYDTHGDNPSTARLGPLEGTANLTATFFSARNAARTAFDEIITKLDGIARSLTALRPDELWKLESVSEESFDTEMENPSRSFEAEFSVAVIA